MEALSLYELNSLVREVIETTLREDYWVQAELAECREVKGHCYMELIQKDERSNTPIAKASAKCWRNTWLMLRPHFERITGQMLHPGMKVLLQVRPQFHEAFGFSWIVTDIDPNYTLGDMARKRQEIIRQLQEEGVFDLNKQIPMPLLPQRIAVISAETAAGYGDFSNQLATNPDGFYFSPTLFPAVMQGERVEQSVIQALNRINESADEFDVVVIIRGGGATSDMSGFDTLLLAENVANFPLPIITGIGHERDESIIDMISHTRVKTPTAAAAFLIDCMKTQLNHLEESQDAIIQYVNQRMQQAQLHLQLLTARIPAIARQTLSTQHQLLQQQQAAIIIAAPRILERHRQHLAIIASALKPQTERRLEQEQHRLELLAQRTHALDPVLLLNRGYSITLKDGHAMTDATTLHPGDKLETRLALGIVKSTVTDTSSKQ